MSFQSRGTYDVIMCDVCKAVSAVGDTRMRLVRRDASGTSHHLCPDCRVWAEWCEAHQQYHRPDDLHRKPCAECGGLYTSRVSQHIEHCPSCLRALSPAPAGQLAGSPPARPRPAERGLVALFSHLGLHNRRR